jgi:hypothetical protein
MPYATVNQLGEIKSTYLKPNPLVKLKAGERMVNYDPPDVDLEYFTVTPVTPVIRKFTEFTFLEKPDAQEKRTLKSIARIDADVDRIYTLVVGNREPEYRQAEAEAIAFQQAQFQGVVPPMVQSYAASDSKSPQQAAESILSKAEDWRQASAAIRAARLAAKAQVRSGDFTGFQTYWAQFLQSVSTTLGVTL